MAALRILLVGGTGFLGTHTVRGLVAGGHRVTVLSRGRRGVPEGCEPLTADRNDGAAVARALGDRRFDLTADFGVFDEPDLAWLAHVATASLGRFVMISTGQVCLVGEGGMMPYREEDSLRPAMPEPAAGTADHEAWSYGMGKRRAETELGLFALRERLEIVALRLPTVQGEEDSSLRLWAHLERLLDGGPFILPDGARRPARFLYAGDIAPALVRIAEAESPTHDAYHLTQPDVMPLRTFIERVAEVAGITPRFVEASWDECHAAGLGPGFLPYAGSWASVLDPSLAVAELGVTCTPSDAYLPRVVRWHLDHRPATSHAGYALRPRELELARRLVAAGRSPRSHGAQP